MFFSHALVALVGFGSLVASAPAPANGDISRRALWLRDSKSSNSSSSSGKDNDSKNNDKDSKDSKDDKDKKDKDKNNDKNKNNKNNNNDITIIVQQTIIQPQITIIQENLGLVNQLALLAEQEFQALVQSQLALIQEIETIKNNIRVNTFLARFSQVNTVIVSVTEVIDLRNGDGGRNTRYMVNQQLADNGKSKSTVVVMLSAASPVTINAAAPTLNLGGLLSNDTSGAAGVVSAAAAPKASASAGSSANMASYDAANPFGQLGQTVIMPYGSKAPSVPNGAQRVADPANIILANQGSLIVEDVTQLNQDCQLFNSNGLSLFNLQSSILQEAAQIAALEASGLSLGSAAALNSAAAGLLAGSGAGAGAVAGTTTAAPAVVETTVAAPPAVETPAAAAPPAVETPAAAPPAAAPPAAEPAAAAPVGFFTPVPAAPAAPAATDAAAAAPAATAAPAAPAASAAAGTGSGVQFVPIPRA